MPARNVIEIVVRVVDQATAGLKSVTTQVSGLGGRINQALGGMSKLAKQALVFAGVGGAIYAAGAAFRKMFGAIEANETAIAQLEAGIRSTGGAAGFTVDQLQEMAARFQDITAYGDEAINQMQSVLLTFTKIRGDQFEEATLQIANLASRLKVDLQAAALQVGKALNDPVLGISMLSRAGIQFTATQKEVIKSLVETNQFVEAQKIILAELETQFGGSAEAARKTFSGALAAVGNRFSDLFEASKNTVQPATLALNDLEKTLNDPGLKEGFQTLLALMLQLVNISAKVGGALASAFGGLGERARETTLNAAVDAKKVYQQLLAKPADERYGFLDKLFGFDKTEAEIRAELQRIEATILKYRSPGLVGARGRADVAQIPTPKDIPPILQPDVQKEIEKAVKSARTSFENQSDAIKENIKVLQDFINEYSNLAPAARDAAGVSESMLANARNALSKLQSDLADVRTDQLASKLEITSISAKRVLDDMASATSEFSERTRTDAQRAADAWLSFRADLETALARGDFGEGTRAAEEYNKRITEYLDKNLELAEVTSKKVQVPMQELSVAGKRAVENLQDAFSDFFVNMDGGFRGLLQNVLRVFQKIVAEAAAARLVKAFNIEGLIKKAEAPGRKAAQAYAEKVFAEISDESQATPGALAKAGGPKVATAGPVEDRTRPIVEQIKRDTSDTTGAISETTAAVTKSGGELQAIIAENTRSAASTAQQQCACVCECIRGLADVLRDVAPQLADEVRGIKIEVPAQTVAERPLPELPQLPEIVVTAPPVEVPPIEVPKIEIPPIEAPPLTLPDLPDFETTNGAIRVYDTSSDKSVADTVSASGEGVQSTIRDSATSTSGAVGRVIKDAAGAIGGDVRGTGQAIINTLFKVMSGGSGFFEDFLSNFGSALLGGAMGGGGARAGGGTVGPARTLPDMPVYRASGGMVPVRVGEEGPETVLLPGGSKVVNERQAAYQAQPVTINYMPQYSIVIEGAEDALETEQRLQAYLAKRDARLKAEMMGMMKENGFGRMR